jgi:hypothetical protein
MTIGCGKSDGHIEAQYEAKTKASEFENQASIYKAAIDRGEYPQNNTDLVQSAEKAMAAVDRLREYSATDADAIHDALKSIETKYLAGSEERLQEITDRVEAEVNAKADAELRRLKQ